GDQSNALVNRLYNSRTGRLDQSVLDDFLKEYDEQVRVRTSWRDRWASYLCNWLRSRPMKLLEAEFLGPALKEFLDFLVPWCFSLRRTSESPEGRKLLGEIFDDGAHFAHKYIFPQEKQPAVINQI